MKIDLSRVVTIDILIRQKATGCPDQLAARLSISRRALFDTLNFMKTDLNAPIVYNKSKETYLYADTGCLNFTFQYAVKELEESS